MRVLREDNTEVEIMETIDYGDTDLRSVIEGDRKYNQNESFASHGFSQQQFEGEELVDVEEESDEEESDGDDFVDLDESFDEE